MKLLILTRSSWEDSNSLGNSLSNFFSGWNVEDIANMYCRASKPNNNICTRYYSITEKDLFKNIFNPCHITGKSFTWNERYEEPEDVARYALQEERLYSFFRKRPFVLAKWGQEILWKVGRWKNSALDQFLLDFKPDVIFSPCFSQAYLHNLLWYIQEKTKAKVVLFHADDYLNVKEFNNSPIQAINSRLLSYVVKKSIQKADLNYCIVAKQKEEYSALMNKDMHLLYKGAEFVRQPIYNRNNGRDLLRIVYVGSTLYGRWKTLGMLAAAIQKINAKQPRMELLIYSQYEPSIKAKHAMVIEGSSYFMGKIPSIEVATVLKDADIVLHLESFDDKERLDTRLSFSTKIVDCMHSGRCILAIGWEEAASINYLLNNDAAIVATDEKSLTEQLKKIVNQPQCITEYAQKGWQCGKRNHQIDVIQKKLYDELYSLVDARKHEKFKENIKLGGGRTRKV